MAESPADLERLVEALARLSPEQRQRVLAGVAEARRLQAPRLTWEQLRRAEGIVSLGGDALEDTERLYDG